MNIFLKNGKKCLYRKLLIGTMKYTKLMSEVLLIPQALFNINNMITIR